MISDGVGLPNLVSSPSLAFLHLILDLYEAPRHPFLLSQCKDGTNDTMGIGFKEKKNPGAMFSKVIMF